jgi:prepilin-type N-terminal cleavage/methylation domain-containing protein
MMKIKNSSGFSLIEVMIALVVLGVGMLGISKMQAILIQSSANADQRSVAVELAQEKIDDLRSFAHLTVGTSTDSIPDTWILGLAPEQLSFEHIATNKGGQLGSVDFSDPTELIRPYNESAYAYALSWDVVDYYFPDPDASEAAKTEDELSGTVPPIPDYKKVTVTVKWRDQGDASKEHSVSLTTIIDAYSPVLTAFSDNQQQGGDPVTAAYAPEAAPDVINVHVDTGNDKYRQTSKPLPDVIKTGHDSNTIVSFDVVTFSNNQIFPYKAESQEQYVTLDCTCQFAGEAAGRTAAHALWDDETDTRFDSPGEVLLKTTAVPVDNANAAEGYCTICCRDHHDTSAEPIKYVEGSFTGDHPHYKLNGSVANPATNDIYRESCRFKRIDGVLRVYQDWKLHDITTMLRADLADGESLQSTYSDYVRNYVLDKVTGTSTAIKPDAETKVTATLGGQYQLQSRGIYIDTVYDPLSALSSTAYKLYVSDVSHEDRLDKVPFSEINLTLLSAWESDAPTNVSVTNEPVAIVEDPSVDYYGTYSRGLITAHAVSTGTKVTSTISGNNNGFTEITDPTNTDVSDAITVDVEP